MMTPETAAGLTEDQITSILSGINDGTLQALLEQTQLQNTILLFLIACGSALFVCLVLYNAIRKFL